MLTGEGEDNTAKRGASSHWVLQMFGLNLWTLISMFRGLLITGSGRSTVILKAQRYIATK